MFTFGIDPYGTPGASYRHEFNAAIGAKLQRGLDAAALILQRELREAVGIPVGKVQRTRQRTTSRGPKGSTYMEVVRRSQPGEPPRKDTGFGQTNIIVWPGAIVPGTAVLTKRIGIRVNAIYMAYLEFGTIYIWPRPWLLTTLEQKADVIAKAFAAGAGAQ